MSLLTAINQTIKASGHTFCTVAYLFENTPTNYETSGELNVAIIKEAQDNPEMELPVVLKTGYISVACVVEDAKERVAKELFQDHNDLMFGNNELQTTKTGYVYAYSAK